MSGFTPEEAKMHGDAMREHCIQTYIDGFRRQPGLLDETKEMFEAMRADGFDPAQGDDSLVEAVRRYEEEIK